TLRAAAAQVIADAADTLTAAIEALAELQGTIRAAAESVCAGDDAEAHAADVGTDRPEATVAMMTAMTHLGMARRFTDAVRATLTDVDDATGGALDALYVRLGVGRALREAMHDLAPVLGAMPA